MEHVGANRSMLGSIATRTNLFYAHIRLEIEIEIRLDFDQLKQSSLILRLVFSSD